jgi:uncharacterized protein involved in outer membrane biogenesis
MNINLAWRIVIFIVAIILVLIIVPVVASLATNAVSFMGESITSLFRPFTLSGDARLEGLIKMCLYLIVITFLIRFLLRR